MFAQPEFPDDTVTVLSQVDIIAPLKQHGGLMEQPVAATSLTLHNIENKRIIEPKDLSLITPNLYLPDYGSKMTSSIYIRGIGTRIDQPAMGLYVDNLPILNKNNYDFDFFDVRRIDILRGPQGTLYGRNTIGGVINVYTLSPFYYQGTRLSAGYANGNTFDVRLATYQRPNEKFGYSAAVNHHQSDGFFTNRYNDSKADRIQSDGLRLRLQWKLSGAWMADHTFSINKVKQKGFAYSRYDEATGEADPVNHNDPCSYDRLGLINGIGFLYKNQLFHFSSTTSYQYTDDKMVLDQDFQPKSMFTITQSQKENAVTQEFVLKSNNEDKKWQWLSGVYGFYKQISMDAPVNFKRDGIDELILENANKGIQSVFPNAELLIEEDEFLIASHFKMPVYSLSAYHQSTFQWNRIKATAGIRFDYEHSSIRYNNYADIHYRFSLTMPQFKPLSTTMSDHDHMTFFELMPRFSLLYEINTENNIYFTIARGYKAGGYNTQIFSDVLQNKMMDNLMSDLGIYYEEDTYDTSSAISYKPEYTWNYEVGSHFELIRHSLKGNLALFFIDCRNQQLTVFPPGKSTGRLMSNAGRTHSFGVELSLNYFYENLHLTGNYGYTNARFVSYNDGNTDFADNYVPHAPQNTVSLGAQYHFDFDHRWLDRLLLQVDWRGVGKIYWNEDNTLSQPFYSQLGASISWKKSAFTFSIWGKNLTDQDYYTFYFRSVGNSFVQRGKPLQAGISLNVNI